MNKHAWGAAALILLAGCGGGDESAPTASTPAAAAAQLRGALSAQAKVAETVSPEQAAEQLLDFAEATFPTLFPSHPTTATLDPFRFRYYADTGTYVGVVVKPNMGYTMDGIYVMGGIFGDTPVHVGQVSSFIVPSDPGTGGNGGASNGCYDLGLLGTTGTQIEVTMQHSGDATGTLKQVWTVNGPKAFEGHEAIETLIQQTGTLFTHGMAAPADSDIRSYQKRTGDAEITAYGSDGVIHTSVNGMAVTVTTSSVNEPPLVDRQYGLAVGESVTQSVTSTTTTTTTGIPGLPSTPNTMTASMTQTIRFIGREKVSVPAKTFDACKFETRVSGAANAVTTTWVIDGKGIPVKIEMRVNGVLSGTTQQATSVKLNGQSL